MFRQWWAFSIGRFRFQRLRSARRLLSLVRIVGEAHFAVSLGQRPRNQISKKAQG